MNRRSIRLSLSKLTACSVCAAGTMLSLASPGSGTGKLSALNRGDGGRIEKLEQLSAEAVAALGKKDGVGDMQVAGTIYARGFSDEGKTSVRVCATPEELAAKASAGRAHELRGSVKGGTFMGVRKIERVNAEAYNAGGKDRRVAAPDGFVKVKKAEKQ